MLHCCEHHQHQVADLWIVDCLEEMDDDLRQRVTPKGASNAISALPGDTQIEDDDIERSIAFFQAYIQEYRLLLYAEPVGEKPSGNDPSFDDVRGDWQWKYQDYAYENAQGTTIDEEKKDELSLLLLDLYVVYLLLETSKLVLEEITLQSWVDDMRDQIKHSHIAEYLLGVGGKNVLDALDIAGLKAMILAQWKYFQKFAEEIKQGKLTGAQILQRIGMYGEAITNGYEQAKAKTHGIRLPEYPADGSQACLMNCRCHWQLKDDPKNTNYVLPSWVLNPTAEHCVTCVENSRKWNPLRVKKGA